MRVPWSIRAGLVGGLLVALGLVVYWAVRAPEHRDAAHRQIDKDLARAAHALAWALPGGGLGAADLDARMKEAGRRAGLRFTVIGEDGAVLADSAVADVRAMENHARRPEVVEALERGESLSSRTSGSVNRGLRYAAVRVPGSRAVARAALDLEAVEAFADEESRFPWVAGLLAVVAAAALAGLLLAPTAAGVRAVARALASLQGGDLAARVPVRGPDFLRGLSSAFNATADRLQADVDRVRTEGARLQAVLDDMTEGVLSIDREERVGFVNRSGRALLRVPDGEAVEGRPLHHFVRDPRLLALVRDALRGQDPAEEDLVQDGPPRRLLRVHAAPVEGGARGAILLLGDVSTLRRLERMRTDFVANVSHELRTPLAAIAGAAETLAEGGLADAEAAPRFVGTIARHADRLRALVDDLLTLSRLESAPETIERVPVDFALVVRQSCEAVAGRARDGQLALEVHADGPVRVLGDPEALRRLVDNLVVNAVTYTPAGGWVRVGLAVDAGRAVLTVADSGIGIAPEHLERIFERFYRVDKARSRAKGGTGLGLAIVKHSVNLHGGAIDVVSRPGAGSTFTVSVPLPREGELPPVGA
ncbi:MAG: PAS domain-containing protein [Planctomycetes bacterium]|nr:PAS domain-containing protein [Planctomycetota bacterium]